MRLEIRTALLALAVGGAAVLLPGSAAANHPVLVEGNNAADGAPGTTAVPPGTAGDYDGDGRVGVAEDSDSPNDRIFGTLNAALAAANNGANGNGHVTIVTSGRFGEVIRLGVSGQPLNGVTIIEAAPGVHANLDAVISGDANNAARQQNVGILIETDQSNRSLILRNLVVRNYMVGLLVRGRARVTVENCRFDSNFVANVLVQDLARLTMTRCSVSAAGMRFTAAGPSPPSPGDGIAFTGNASGCISRSTISGNTAAGIRHTGLGQVRLLKNNISDNRADLAGAGRFRFSGDG